MLRKAGRRWRRSLGWILLFTFIITLTVGIYIRFYEKERYVAEYTLCAVPQQQGQKPAPLSMWMLLRDYNRLLDEESFRRQVVAQTMSDGRTFINARGSAGDHMVLIRAAGRDPEISLGLANAVGDKLVNESVQLLGVASASTVSRAQLLPLPGTMHDVWRLLLTMLVSFALLSLLGMLIGSRRENVCWNRMPEEVELAQLGQVADCDQSCDACVRTLTRSMKKNSKQEAAGRQTKTRKNECRLLTSVDRLVREGVDEIALALRANADLHSSAIAVTGVRAEDDAPALAVLLGQTLAEEGYSVLMLEMDGDRPSLRKYLGVSGRVDVVDCLEDNSRLPYAILRTATPNLNLIDCCHDGENIRKAVSSARCRTFIQDALAIYDYVILNAPPASFGNGAAAVGCAADQTVLVARDDRYTAKELNSIALNLRQRAVGLSGLVFVGVKKRQLRAVYKADGKAYQSRNEAL